MRSIHTDHVGSLLRPRELLHARKAFSDGTIGSAELKAAEDRAVDHVVTLQEQAGCEIITDGELRRLSFQSQILESVDGFGEWDLEAFLWGDWYGDGLEPWHRPRPARLGVVAPLRRKRHLSAEEFTYLRARTKRLAKVTLPSPSFLSSFWSPTRSREAYPTLGDFLQAVTDILREEVEELVRLGCRYIQLDAPHYPLLIEPKVREFYERQGWTVDEWLTQGIELDNTLMDAIPDVTFGFHLCRGNQASRWLVSGSYELIAKRIFQSVKATRLLLECDDERSGDFQPLRHVPGTKCQGRSKIRPRWRRKTRPPGRWAECLSAVVRTGWSGVWDRPWGGLRRSGNPCAQPAPSWGGGVRAPGRPRGGGPSCCVRGGSCRR